MSEPFPGDPDYCYLTTTRRISGRPHTVELWFVLEGATVYLMHEPQPGGPLADWIRNLFRHPEVSIRLASRDAPEITANARLVTAPSAEDGGARELSSPGTPRGGPATSARGGATAWWSQLSSQHLPNRRRLERIKARATIPRASRPSTRVGHLERRGAR